MVLVAYGRHATATGVVEQCRQALDAARPCMLLAFCGGKHEPYAVAAALRAAFGADVPLVGGSAAGVIWRGGVGYSGLELGLAAFVDADVTPRIVTGSDLRGNEHAVAKELGAKIADVAPNGSVVLFFYDSVASTTPLRLHPGSAIVAGLEAGLKGCATRLIGGGMLTDMNLSSGWVFDGTGVSKHAAVALVFPPAVAEETVILHGCRPASAFMKVTRIDGAEVYELDGEPALDVIERMLGIPAAATEAKDLSLIATLGEKQGDPYAPYDESSYVNRLILRMNRATGSVTLFEPDFQKGARVQIMSRDNSMMLDSVRDGMARINSRVSGRDTLLGLYIDCAGRASARSGAGVEEAELVRDGLDPSIALLGFYSGVEIAPFGDYSRPLDWTGVLTVLHRRP